MQLSISGIPVRFPRNFVPQTNLMRATINMHAGTEVFQVNERDIVFAKKGAAFVPIRRETLVERLARQERERLVAELPGIEEHCYSPQQAISMTKTEKKKIRQREESTKRVNFDRFGEKRTRYVNWYSHGWHGRNDKYKDGPLRRQGSVHARAVDI